MTYVDLDPAEHRAVEVKLYNGRWVIGHLEAYRRDRGGTWRGFVRWSEGVGLTRIAWLGKGLIPPQ